LNLTRSALKNKIGVTWDEHSTIEWRASSLKL
jgi:hypothetical protein